MSVHPERLADQAAQPVARHRAADGPNTDRHAEPRFALIVWRALHEEERVAVPLTPLARAIEVGGGVEFLAGPQSVAP